MIFVALLGERFWRVGGWSTTCVVLGLTIEWDALGLQPTLELDRQRAKSDIDSGESSQGAGVSLEGEGSAQRSVGSACWAEGER